MATGHEEYAGRGRHARDHGRPRSGWGAFVHYPDAGLISWALPSGTSSRASALDSCTIRGVGRLLAVLAVVVLVMPACSEVGEQIDQTTNDTVARALAANVRDRLAEEGIELDGDPECTTDMNVDGVDLTGTAECTGTTTDGRSAKANFDGTLSPGRCEGSFVIEVDGEQVVDLTEIPGCSIEF
jgi:hypothetical protein